MRPVRSVGLLGALIALVCLTLPGAASARGVPSEVIGHGRLPHLAVSDTGHAVVVWRHGKYPRLTLQAATRASGGRWSRPRTVGPFGAAPEVGIDAQGRAVAVWTTAHVGASGSVLAATWERGRWSKPETLASFEASDLQPVSRPAVEPRLAVNRRGEAAVVWLSRPAGQWVGNVNAVTRTRRGRWSAPRTLGQATTRPDVAVSDQGDIEAIWTSDLALDGRGAVEATTRSRGSRWSVPTVIAVGDPPEDQDFAPATVRASGDGTLTALWRHWDQHAQSRLEVATRTPGGPWSAAVDLGVADSARVTVRDREALVVWKTPWHSDAPPDAGTRRGYVYASSRDGAGAWSSPTEVVLSESYAGDPDLAMSARGYVVTVSVGPFLMGGEVGAVNYEVETMSRTPAGRWSRLRTIYRPPRGPRGEVSRCANPRVAMNSVGRTFTAWHCAVPGRRGNVMVARIR